MNLITLPVVPANQLVADVDLDTGSLESSQLPMDELPALDELPQGALTLMAQIQPLRQPALALSIGDDRLIPVTSSKVQGENIEVSRLQVDKRQVIAHTESSMDLPLATKAVLSAPAVTALTALSLPRSPSPSPSPSSPSSPSSTLPVLPPTALMSSTLTTSDSAPVTTIISNINPVPEVDKNDGQPLLMPVQVSAEKNSSPLMPVQTPNAQQRPGGDNPPLPPMPLHTGSTNYLKVPFSKGEAIGQVIINKPSPEAPQLLQLSTNNPDVSSLLRDNVQSLHEPRWRLVEHQYDQQGQGQDRRPSPEESDENAGDGNPRRPMQQETEV
ncbi:hypothetical protein [Pseudomonas fluorescens]|uniref:Type III secretion effector protein n=1 Tax=Pseudomonas fluorescens TaxID=294 RepID=A0A5E7GAV6_PSEFL|nr:hypothetical protein [Pseudomonas fluorescens]VVO48396.1 hypothetical protein PS880_00169 [Pseudomonas fluorescens]